MARTRFRPGTYEFTKQVPAAMSGQTFQIDVTEHTDPATSWTLALYEGDGTNWTYVGGMTRVGGVSTVNGVVNNTAGLSYSYSIARQVPQIRAVLTVIGGNVNLQVLQQDAI